MQSRNFHALETPIIGRVIELNNLLLRLSSLPEKKIQHVYCQSTLKNGELLFTYAMRQLKGKDYKKRAFEIIEEIQSQAYLIYSVKGWDKKCAIKIDMLCDDLCEQICKISSASITKSTDESK